MIAISRARNNEKPQRLRAFCFEAIAKHEVHAENRSCRLDRLRIEPKYVKGISSHQIAIGVHLNALVGTRGMLLVTQVRSSISHEVAVVTQQPPATNLQ